MGSWGRACGLKRDRSRLKTWMRRFNGVATKYLPNYLGWRRMFEREGENISPQRCLLAALA